MSYEEPNTTTGKILEISLKIYLYLYKGVISQGASKSYGVFHCSFFKVMYGNIYNIYNLKKLNLFFSFKTFLTLLLLRDEQSKTINSKENNFVYLNAVN